MRLSFRVILRSVFRHFAVGAIVPGVEVSRSTLYDSQSIENPPPILNSKFLTVALTLQERCKHFLILLRLPNLSPHSSEYLQGLLC